MLGGFDFPFGNTLYKGQSKLRFGIPLGESHIFYEVVIFAKDIEQHPERIIVNTGKALDFELGRDVVVSPMAKFSERDFLIKVAPNMLPDYGFIHD